MAMEYKTVNVPNELEENAISNFGHFGWTLKSSQRVFNRNSHNEYSDYGSFIGITTVTNTVDFTKLVFERDKKLPNYDQIAQLEESAIQYSNEEQHLLSEISIHENTIWRKKGKIDVRPAIAITINKLFIIVPIIFLIFSIFAVQYMDVSEGLILVPFMLISMIAPIISGIVYAKTKRYYFENMIASPESNQSSTERWIKKWEHIKKKDSFYQTYEDELTDLYVRAEECKRNISMCMSKAEALCNY